MSEMRNIAVDQSANVLIEIAVSNSSGGVLDMSNYTANGCIKRHYESANVALFTSAAYANGLMTLALTAVESANLDTGRYVYEGIITENTSNTTIRVQQGILFVKSSVC